MSEQKSTPINAILIALVGVLVGFIGGYVIGQSRAPVSTAATAAGLFPGQGGITNCPHSLETKDIGIIAGFRCPGTDDSQVLLADCHCPVAHGIEDLVKAEVAAGKTPAEIREGVLAQYGDRLNFAGR